MCGDAQSSAAEISRLHEVSKMMADAPINQDFNDLGDRYIAALEAQDRARTALHRAESTVQRRENELRSAYERLTGKGSRS